MIYLRHTHPDFDLELEVLSTLPRESSGACPQGARLDDLVTDLGLPNQAKLQQVLMQLKCKFDVRTTVVKDQGRLAFITHQGWLKAKTAANTYWKKLYVNPLRSFYAA